MKWNGIEINGGQKGQYQFIHRLMQKRLKNKANINSQYSKNGHFGNNGLKISNTFFEVGRSQTTKSFTKLLRRSNNLKDT